MVFHSINQHILPKVIPLAIPTTIGHQYTIPSLDYDRIEEEYKIAGKKILEKTEKKFKEEGISVETRLITAESPEDYIKRISDEEKFDLILLGEGGKSGVEKFFLGSVSENALKEAPCDVLIAK